MSDAEEALPKPKRRWIPIVIGVFLLLFVLGIGAVVFSVSWFRQNLQITEVSDTNAAEPFEAIRAKFPGQRPLLEMRDGKPRLVDERRSGPRSNASLTTLHLLAWDGDEGKLVKFDLPFWLLRMKSGPIQFGSYASGFDDRGVNLRVEDIERHGPGIVLDFAEAGEGRVLIWAE